MALISDEYSNVKVALRIRPQLAREKIEACRVCTFVTENEPQVTLGKDKSFTYDHVFVMGTDQKTFYDTCCKTLVEGCFKGYNATILAYGQTGSGKTYTMGTSFDANCSTDAGVIPRALYSLFEGIEEKIRLSTVDGVAFKKFQVFVQFMELYNEDIIDLLDQTGHINNKHKTKLKIHEDSKGEICVSGMTQKQVFSADEALEVLHNGAVNRTTASTQMNSTSSRSHAIFSIHIKQTSIIGTCLDKESISSINDTNFETLTAKLHFTDLAGSERLKRTGATGERMREGVSINSGLLALGNVISALGDVSKKSTHIPYRDSKLTRVLQDSLGGNSRTLMIACVSPSDSDFMETLNTLKYANRAKNIKNKVVINQDTSSKQILALRKQIANLQLELTEYKSGKRIVSEEGAEVYNDIHQENLMLKTENKNLTVKLKVAKETTLSLQKNLVELKTDRVSAEVFSAVGADDTVKEMVENYITEIESLKTKLIESQTMCSTLQKKQSIINYSNDLSSLGRPKTPLMNVLIEAKKNIQALEIKKQNLISQTNHDFSSFNFEKEDLNQDSTPETSSDSDSEQKQVSQSDEELDEELETSKCELEQITAEVSMKETLINELEHLQKRLTSMQNQYEKKLKLMSEQIKITEQERDRVLQNLSNIDDSDKKKIEKVHEKYNKKIEQMKKQMKTIKEAEKAHQKRLQQQSKSLSQINKLKSELNRLKTLKMNLDKKVKEDKKKNKAHSLKLTKDLLKMKKDYKIKAIEIKRLEMKNRQKDNLMQLKANEIQVLKNNLNAAKNKRKRASSVSKHSTYHHTKGNKKSVNSSENSLKFVWDKVEENLKKVLMRNETIASIEKQMKKLIKDRENLQQESKTIDTNHQVCSSAENQLDQEEDLQANSEFINEQIQQCQMEIMELEKGADDLEKIRTILNSCELNVSKYISNSLLSMFLEKYFSDVNSHEKIKDLESKLATSLRVNSDAEKLIKCILNKKSDPERNDKGFKSENSISLTSNEPSTFDGPAKLLGPTSDFKLNWENAAVFSKLSLDVTAVKARTKNSKASAKDLMQLGEDKPFVFKRQNSMRDKLMLEKINPDEFRCTSAVVSPTVRSPEVFSRLMTKPIYNTPHKGKMSLNHNKLSISSAGIICTHVAEGHKKAVLSVQANDHLLFSGSKDRSVKVWNLVTGQEILTLDGHPNNVSIVRQCPTTNLVYSVSLCYVKVWDIRTKPICIRVLSSEGALHQPSSFHRSLQRTNEMPDNEQQITDLKISTSSKYMFCAAGTSVNVWDLNSLSVCTKLTGHKATVMSMEMSSSDSPTIITGSKDRYVRVYEYSDYSKTSQLNCYPTSTLIPPHLDGVESLVYLDKSNTLFTASRDKSIKKWDISRSAVVNTCYQAHNNWVCSVGAFESRSNGSILMSGGRNGLLKAWNTNSMMNLGEIKAHESQINCITSNSLALFTAANDSTIKLWKCSI